eukprot:scaffold337578_cov57-Attheya_sp.AAC.1
MDNHMRDVDGNRIIYVLPALLDTKLESSALYDALATALYFDCILDRHQMETIALVIDVRPGKSWANPLPPKVFPYIKAISKYGVDLFPEHMSRIIVVPVPTIAVGLWNTVRGFLHKKHAAKIRLVGGSANLKASLPPQRMKEYIPDEHAVHSMEECRLSEFVNESRGKKKKWDPFRKGWLDSCNQPMETSTVVSTMTDCGSHTCTQLSITR